MGQDGKKHGDIPLHTRSSIGEGDGTDIVGEVIEKWGPLCRCEWERGDSHVEDNSVATQNISNGGKCDPAVQF